MTLTHTQRIETYLINHHNGYPITHAAHTAGISATTAQTWHKKYTRPTTCYAKTMQHNPDTTEHNTDNTQNRKTLHLTQQERTHIHDWIRCGDSIREIARKLGRSPSTISREIARNTNPETNRYEASLAEQLAKGRRSRPKERKLATNPALHQYVQNGIEQYWSPGQISQRLIKEHPEDETMRISAETIYQAMYIQGRGKLKTEVQKALRQGKAVRRKRGERKPRQRFKDEMIMISERDKDKGAREREVPGHWEGDLICGKANRSAIVSLVERVSRFTVLLALPSGRHDAVAVRDAVVGWLRGLPAGAGVSLAWDQGAEMALHSQVAADGGVEVYFCDPGSPWQRPSNENTNGLVRQFLPKGMDLSGVSQVELDVIAGLLNNRPRGVLEWSKPQEVWDELFGV